MFNLNMLISSNAYSLDAISERQVADDIAHIFKIEQVYAIESFAIFHRTR